MSNDAQLVPKPVRLSLWRGSFRAAMASYLSPPGEKEGPIWAHLLVMIGSNTLIALLITLAALPGSWVVAREIFWKIFPFSQLIGGSIILLHTVGQAFIGEERIRSWPLALHIGYRVAIAVLGVFIGYTLGLDWRLGTVRVSFDAFRDDGFIASIGIALVASFAFYQILSSKLNTARAQAEAERERTRSVAAEAREAAARLQLLQAQIEPHFLFNTLANVLGLIDQRPVDAKQMLEDFIFYLRASLNVTRNSESNLGAELDLLRRYLSIFRFRMGSRLAYFIECPDELRSIPLAPMLLQPLVENSIQHGLEPKVEGGTISVRVTREGAELRIVISDTGLGFHPIGTPGVGLANVRERLYLLYGERAHLSIEEGKPSGTLATIAIGLPDAPAGGVAAEPGLARAATAQPEPAHAIEGHVQATMFSKGLGRP